MSGLFTIVSLCDRTGNWAQPYREAGYEVVQVDLSHGQDVRLLERPSFPVRGVLAAPPCTCFASSGARWQRSPEDMREALSVVDACLRFITAVEPLWWALENPIGTLGRWIGPPRMYFHPSDYGDPYTKRTALWGRFRYPEKHPVAPTEGSKMHRLPPSDERAALRSETPHGFARAFFEANP